MRRRRLKKLWRRLGELCEQKLSRDQLLLQRLKLTLPPHPPPRITVTAENPSPSPPAAAL